MPIFLILLHHCAIHIHDFRSVPVWPQLSFHIKSQFLLIHAYILLSVVDDATLVILSHSPISSLSSLSLGEVLGKHYPSELLLCKLLAYKAREYEFAVLLHLPFFSLLLCFQFKNSFFICWNHHNMYSPFESCFSECLASSRDYLMQFDVRCPVTLYHLYRVPFQSSASALYRYGYSYFTKLFVFSFIFLLSVSFSMFLSRLSSLVMRILSIISLITARSLRTFDENFLLFQDLCCLFW